VTFEDRGRQSRRGCQFWCICCALRRLLRKTGFTYSIMFWGQSAHRESLPICLIWLEKIYLNPRYGGSNLQKSSFYVFRAQVGSLLRHTGLLDSVVLWRDNVA